VAASIARAVEVIDAPLEDACDSCSYQEPVTAATTNSPEY
jgi:hypothetical protein